MKVNNNPEDYIVNNIDFRVTSSRMLSEYKNTQNFVLMEVSSGQYPFSRTSKEMILLYSDSVFKMLMLFERAIVLSGSGTISKRTASNIEKILSERVLYMESVVKIHNELFDDRYVKVWKDVHFPIGSLIHKMIENSTDSTAKDFFTSISMILIETLDKMRFELYEIDYLVNNGANPFLIVTDLCFVARDLIMEDLLVERARVYMKEFNIKGPFILKNYTTVFTNYAMCEKSLKEAGIQIISDIM